MKVSYDATTDVLLLVFRDAPVHDSDEAKPGLIFDYDEAGNVLAIEILDASTRVSDPATVTMMMPERRAA